MREVIEMAKILFSELVNQNETALKSEMEWRNYGLNDTEMLAEEILKTHALRTLKRSYGKYYVDDDILEELKEEIFINFPSLMQQLSISRVVTGLAVLPVDTLKEQITRNETTRRENSDSSTVTVGTSVNETSQVEGLTSGQSLTNDTGTVASNVTNDSNTSSSTSIDNSSNVEITGGKQVNLAYSLPNQAINGSTSNFPVDAEGTPDLSDATVNSATATHTTSNPLNNVESSEQSQNVITDASTDSLVTNNLSTTSSNSVNESNSATRTIANTGSDTSNNQGLETNEHNYSETIEREATNAQFSYEITNFLEASESHNAFRTWVNLFWWITPIL